MNKQFLVFGIGGILAAVVMIFFLSKPAEENQLDQVLSEIDQQTGQQGQEPDPTEEVRDTMDQIKQTEKKEEAMSNNTPPEMQIDQSKTYTALLKTSEGDVTIQLTASETPITVNNFVSLARNGFYNGTIFHRVIKGFMIQGGDPEATGAGGPGYQFDDEPFEGEYTRGTVAMANAGRNTNGSQFFIMHQDYPLPKNYVIFGKVASGMDVVDTIASAEVTASALAAQSQPVNPVKVESVEIVEE